MVGPPSALAAEVAHQDDLAARRARRRRAAMGAIAAGALAAGMALVFFVGRNPASELAALHEGPHRLIEGRLS